MTTVAFAQEDTVTPKKVNIVAVESILLVGVFMYWALFVAAGITVITEIGFYLVIVLQGAFWFAFYNDARTTEREKVIMFGLLVGSCLEYSALHSLNKDYGYAIPYPGIMTLAMVILAGKVNWPYIKSLLPLKGQDGDIEVTSAVMPDPVETSAQSNVVLENSAPTTVVKGTAAQIAESGKKPNAPRTQSEGGSFLTWKDLATALWKDPEFKDKYSDLFNKIKGIWGDPPPKAGDVFFSGFVFALQDLEIGIVPYELA